MRKAQHRAVFVDALVEPAIHGSLIVVAACRVQPARPAELGLTLDVSLPIVHATTSFRRDCVRSEARARFALCASPPLL